MGKWHDRIAGRSHAGEEKRGVWHDSCRLVTPETEKKQGFRGAEPPPREASHPGNREKARVPGCGAARKRSQPPRKQGKSKGSGVRSRPEEKQATPETGKKQEFRGAEPPGREVSHPGNRKKARVPGCGAARKGSEPPGREVSHPEDKPTASKTCHPPPKQLCHFQKGANCHIFEKIIGYIGNMMRGREAVCFPDSIE